MALEYDYYLDGEVNEDFVKRKIAELSEEKAKAGGKFPLEAFTFEVTPYLKETIRTNFGFTPIVGYTFVLDKFASADDSSSALILTSLAIVDNESISNSVLLFNGEIPIFHYSGKTLFLNESRGYWNKEKIDLVKIPYMLKSIPVL